MEKVNNLFFFCDSHELNLRFVERKENRIRNKSSKTNVNKYNNLPVNRCLTIRSHTSFST